MELTGVGNELFTGLELCADLEFLGLSGLLERLENLDFLGLPDLLNLFGFLELSFSVDACSEIIPGLSSL